MTPFWTELRGEGVKTLEGNQKFSKVVTALIPKHCEMLRELGPSRSGVLDSGLLPSLSFHFAT